VPLPPDELVTLIAAALMASTAFLAGVVIERRRRRRMRLRRFCRRRESLAQAVGESDLDRAVLELLATAHP
jgi:hypothetical protein